MEKKEENLVKICEKIERCEKLKREYVAKTVELEIKELYGEYAASDKVKDELNVKIKELRVMKIELNKERKNAKKKKKEQLEAEEKAKKAEKAKMDSEEAEKKRIKVEMKKTQILARIEAVLEKLSKSNWIAAMNK